MSNIGTAATGTVLTGMGAGISPKFQTPAPALTWTDVTGTSASAVVNNGYLADNSSLVTITLPATAPQFSILAVAGYNTGGWKIAQNANQSIKFGSSAGTTTGTGGSLASSNQYDCVYLLAAVGGASTIWTVLNSVGNITVV